MHETAIEFDGFSVKTTSPVTVTKAFPEAKSNVWFYCLDFLTVPIIRVGGVIDEDYFSYVVNDGI